MRKNLLFNLALFLVLALNLYFRSFPINFPQLKAQAKNNVEQRIRNEAIFLIERSSSQLYPQAKERLIDFYLKNYKKEKRQEFKKQIEQQYLRLKDRYQDSSGQTYLQELDCWHWARYVENILKHGYPGDKIISAKQQDTFMLAPLGMEMSWNNFLFYFSASLYKIFSLIKALPLYNFLFYLPLFFTAILIILLFWFSYTYAGGIISAIVSTLFAGLSPVLLQRSACGWFDNDVLNLVFPLLIVWTYLKANQVNFLKNKLFWLFFSSFWVGLFCFTWQNWWFIFLIIIIYESFSLLNLVALYLQYKIKDKDSFKRHFISLLGFICFSFLWIILFCGLRPLFALYSQVKGALTLNQPLTGSIWPNVYYTVGELRRANVIEIAQYLGNPFLFFFSWICLLVIFLISLRQKEEKEKEHTLITILTFWFISMFFACFKGIRFSMFLLLPLGISLGWGLSKFYLYFKNKNKLWRISLYVFILILIAQIIQNAYSSARRIFPLMDDTWYRVLNTIKETTPKEAILNSWWDFGDWFKVVAKRRVIFDGQSQNTPQAYWMAYTLLTENEEEAVAILRMLNNGGNQAFEIINKYLKDPFRAVFLLKKLLLLSKDKAKETLEKYLPKEPTEEIINILFSKPPPAYFIVEYTMIPKMPPISYLGRWDFAKVYLAQNVYKKPKKQIIDYLISLGVPQEIALRLYEESALISKTDFDYWLSQGLSLRGNWLKGEEKDGIVFFEGGLLYHLKNEVFYFYSPSENRYKIPRSLLIFSEDKLKEISYPDSEVNFSILLFKQDNIYQALPLDSDLINSLFVRLYFLRAKGLKHFKPFLEEREGNNYIRVFEINWD